MIVGLFRPRHRIHQRVQGREATTDLQEHIAEQERTLEALPTDEQQLRSFVKHSPSEIIMLDRDLRYLVVSRPWLQSCGLSEQEVIGRHHHEMSPNTPEHWKAVHRRCLTGAVERCEQDAYPQPDGSIRWVRWEARPWHDTAGEIGGIIIFREDVAERKWVEELPSKTIGEDITEARNRPEQVSDQARHGRPAPKSFNLLRSFALLSLLSITLITGVSAVVLLRFLANHMLERDAVVTMEFIQSVAQSGEQELSFADPDVLNDKEGLGQLFVRIAEMPDVVRANVYAPDRTIVWSTDEELIGRRFDVNPELQHALSGQPVYELVDRSKGEKAEHAYFSDDVTEFVENYIPIWNRDRSVVIAVAEVYKVPRALFQAMENGRWLVWISATVGGLFLYATLFWVVRRASVVMRGQQEQLVTSEMMAAVGEMASAVAHGIRNPLASIRSRAELAAQDSAGVGHEAAEDITKEVDHLEQWVRELLLFSRPEGGNLELIPIAEVVRDSLNGFSRTMENQGVELVLDIQETVPVVHGDIHLLGQLFNSLVANALEAMPDGGVLKVSAHTQGKDDDVNVTIVDTGSGIPEDRLDEVFKPFVTGKRSGLGLGLPLAKRIAERHGGDIAISSHQGRGTTVSLHFPKGA